MQRFMCPPHPGAEWHEHVSVLCKRWEWAYRERGTALQGNRASLHARAPIAVDMQAIE